MNEFIERQLKVFLDQISDYRRGCLMLTTLVSNLEALLDLIDIEALKQDLRTQVQDIEVLNAITIDRGGEMTSKNKIELNTLLVNIETIIREYRTEHGSNGHDDGD